MMASEKKILLVCCLLIPLSGFGTDLYAPSLPHIASFFSVSSAYVQWSMTVFVLGFSLGQIPFGVLSDSWGRKKTLLLSLAVFIFASMMILLARNIGFIIAMRFLQGIATGGPSSVSKAVLNDSFSGESHGRSFALQSFCWGLGPVLAPWIGGHLQHHFGWESNFYFYVCLGVFLFAITFLLLPETNKHRHSFSVSTFKQRTSFIFAKPIFWFYTSSMAVGYVFIIAFNMVAPFLVQHTLAKSAIVYGRLALLIGLAWLIGSIITRFLLSSVDRLLVVRVSCCACFFISLLGVISLLYFHLSLLTLVAPVFALVVLTGVFYPACISGTMICFPREYAGTVAALLGLVSFLETALLSVAASYFPLGSAIPMFLYFLLLSGMLFCVAFFTRN